MTPRPAWAPEEGPVRIMTPRPAWDPEEDPVRIMNPRSAWAAEEDPHLNMHNYLEDPVPCLFNQKFLGIEH